MSAIKSPERYIDRDTTDIDERMTILLRALSAANELHLALAYPGFEPYTYGIDKGRKYTRVWQDNGTQRFVCFFVDNVTGDVWKAAGWPKPALNFTRGNIMTREGIAALTLGRIAENGHFYAGF